MKGMKKLLFGIIFTAFAIVSINSAVFARGGDSLTVEIPFDFYVRNEKLNAGEYEVQKNTEDVFVLRNVETGKKIILSARISAGKNGVEAEKVVFNKYGDRYFLREVYMDRLSLGRDLGESKTEKKIRKESADDSQLAENAKPKTVSISLGR